MNHSCEFIGYTPAQILYLLKNGNIGCHPNGTNPTYIIMGRPGPTGKTWLRNELVKNGFNAIEISEDIFFLVNYRDDNNLIIVRGDHVVIVLNQILEMYRRDEK